MKTDNLSPALSESTIMVVMPHGWKGGFFRVAAAICNALDQIEFRGSRFRVVLGVPSGYDCTEGYLLNPDVEVVQVGYKNVDSSDRRFLSEKDAEFLSGLPLVTPFHTLPYGDTALIGEVDAYILLSALFFEGVFVTTKPHAVYVADLIQRYVPAIYSDVSTGYDAPSWKMDRNQRAALKKANCVFSTTPQTLSDVMTYGGVHPDKAMLFPMFAVDIADHSQGAKSSTFRNRDLVDIATDSTFSITPNSYFIWVTNASAHKNHVNAIKALRHYYEALGGKLKCLVCGPATEMLVPGKTSTPYHKSVYSEVNDWPAFSEHVKLIGYPPDEQYLSLLSNAKFLWHNVLYDNGTFSMLEAASVGTGTLSSHYPQVRFIDETYDVGARFFDPRDALDAANKLLEFELSKKSKRPIRIGETKLDDFLESLEQLLLRLFLD